jgi:hypothetical protein
MNGNVSCLIDRIAAALENHACADFQAFVAQVLPVVQGDRAAVIVDVEPDLDPPSIVIVTADGWLVVVDPHGVRAGKPDPEQSLRRGRPRPSTAVQRRFVRAATGTPATQRRDPRH